MAQAPRTTQTQLFGPSCTTDSFLQVLVTYGSDSLFSVSLEFSFSESHGPRKGSPDGSAARNRLQCRRRGDVGSVSGSGRSPGGGNGKPGKSHGQRSLGGYSPWGHRESDAAERGSRKLSEVAQDCGP